MEAPVPSVSPGSPHAVLRTAATSLLALAAAIAVYLALRPAAPQPAVAVPPSEEGAALVEGEDYRVLVAVARVRPEKPGGGRWDRGSAASAAPDPYYEIWWRGHLVYRSPVVRNTLVAAWSNVSLPDLYRLLAGEQISLETIREGALLTARPGENLEVRIYDSDLFRDDLIEHLTLDVGDLRVGDMVLEGSHGLESATLRVLPRDTRQLKHYLR